MAPGVGPWFNGGMDPTANSHPSRIILGLDPGSLVAGFAFLFAMAIVVLALASAWTARACPSMSRLDDRGVGSRGRNSRVSSSESCGM